MEDLARGLQEVNKSVRTDIINGTSGPILVARICRFVSLYINNRRGFDLFRLLLGDGKPLNLFIIFF